MAGSHVIARDRPVAAAMSQGWRLLQPATNNRSRCTKYARRLRRSLKRCQRMSNSPRKHRAPFRAINTLSSEKPAFPNPALPSVDDYSSFLDAQDISETDLLGNSSSLFDQSLHNLRPSPSPARPYTNGNMVREREAPAPSQPQRTDPPLAKAIHDLTDTPPAFGEASPLRNPLKKDVPRDSYSHLFNVPKPGQTRVEHHRQPQRVSSEAPPAYTTSGYNAPSHPFRSNPPPAGPRPGTASSTGSDLFEITATQFQQFQPRQPYQGVPVPKPANYQAQTIHPPPRPLYSSVGPSNGFQPVNSGFNPLNPHGSRQTVIVPDPFMRRRDDDDEFDPDAALRAEGNRFGAPDPLAYVDSSQAHDNIKALLEGAFDGDDEKIPRTRGRKKKKQQQDEYAANSLASKLAALQVKEVDESSGENGEAEEEEDEEDDGTVEGMTVKLLPHQVEGVAWMIEKETGAHMKRVPPKGGILADDMGLGKTIQSIALILSNSRPAKDAEPENKKNKILSTVGKGTLIIAPLALIKQWEAEIKDKVTKSHSLKVYVHHGPSRTKSAEKLKSYDVVVTTYQVLASEHGACGDGPDGLKKGCFGVHWYRVILDEAHTIKNRNAKMTKACYDVRAHYRWCLTGTPMQNNLDELQSLIRFLNIKPYCELSSWKDSIAGPMKNGRGNLAMRRLQIFLKTFMKRRTKDVLKKEGGLTFGGKGKDGEEKKSDFQIVDRNVEVVIGSFTAKEREFYDRLSNRAETRLAEMMGGEKTDYIGALVLLLRLRQACNHPNLTKSNMKADKDALETGTKSQPGTQTPRKGQDTDADDLADLFGGMTVETKRCDVCQVAMRRDNAAAGAIRCDDCEHDLNASQKKSRKHKKHQKHKHKDRKQKKERKPKSESDGEDENEDEEKPRDSKSSRQRRVIFDSDDEDEEGGEWLVPEDQQKATDLGKAGGTDDENAEGVGDSLGSIDSDSFATEADDTPSKKKQNDSFIVHDTDSEDEAPVARRKQMRQKKVISLVSEDDADSTSDSDTGDTDSDSQSGSESDSEESEGAESDIEYNASDLTPSTKIRQLLSILDKETPDHKVIVFSQFTSMLDLIEPFLRREGYTYTRYDGSMRNDLREASLAKLRNDKRTRVLLCSLKCGSLGLNLTAASRVVIMEPFWNPVSS